jgi:methyl-accepting chemotaxis protein
MILSIICAVGAIFILTLLFYYQTKQSVESEVHAARNIILMAESVRENMAGKWRLGLFTPEFLMTLDGYDEEERLEKILATVPVVAAWKSAQAKSKEAGFEFRTPRQHARNPDHEPDHIEQQVLQFFDQNPSTKEYFLIDQELNAIRYFRPVRLGKMCLYCHGNPEQSATVWKRNDGKDITGHAMDDKQEGDLHGAFEVIKPLTEAQAQTRQKIMLFGSLMVIGLLVLIVVIHWLSQRMVAKPIDNVLQIMSQAQRAGDLTTRLPAQTNQEMSRMADGFNLFIERIQNLLQEVNQSVQFLKDVTQKVTTVTRNTNTGVQKQQSELNQVVNVMQKMKNVVESVSQHTTAAAQAAQHANNESITGQQVVHEVIAVINRLAAEIENASKIMSQLAADSDNIGAVIDVIRGIAEQTNLLALNAAIEAARAGEQGRGFAVVADEVRNLANRTQQSTLEIQTMIEKLQQGANTAAQVMQQGQTQVKLSVTQSANAETSLTAITQAVSTILTMNHQIVDSVAEQIEFSEKISHNIVNINTITNTTADGAQETAQTTNHLNELAEKLNRQLNEFKI